jgi:hypothetical protein
MKNAFIVQVAQKSDLERIINFLTQPEIDQGFCKPLSDRNISITNRVFSKYKQGVWLFAEIDDRIISCIAIVPEGEAVSFSTFACINNLKCKLAGAAVWHKSLQLAEEIFDCSCIEIDSWAGNEFINRFLTKRGFEKIKTYPDPDKRPVSVDSVLYRMTLEHNS